MAIEIGLVPSIHAEIVMHVIVGRAVVVVEAAPICSIIGYNEVVVHIIFCRNSAWFSIANRSNVRQSVPRIESSMIRRLTTCIKEQVIHHLTTAPKPVVEIDCSTWQIEGNVLGEARLSTNSLEETTGLLLIHANLIAKVAFERCETWLLPARAVVAIFHTTPKGNTTHSQPCEFVFHDRSPAVVTREKYCVCFQAHKRIVTDADILGALQ
mmetsp:Transcript_46529/g.74796  ORF Transcript_46529/g.74796 Transcript_46529/m.74796 type:complete len:211 (-) Transcript_46529:341-973(-)